MLRVREKNSISSDWDLIMEASPPFCFAAAHNNGFPRTTQKYMRDAMAINIKSTHVYENGTPLLKK